MSSSARPSRKGWRPGDDLEPIEHRMIRAAATGEPLGPDNCAAEPMATIRAAVLCHLLSDKKWPVSAKGVQLHGLRVDGQLDLEAATLRCPLRLEDCSIGGSEPVNLDYASLSLLTFVRCTLPGLSGRSLSVSKNLDLRGSTLTGPLLLQGADVAGDLDCSGTELDGVGFAFYGQTIKVGGDVFLTKAVATDGGIDLRGADIGGCLQCTGAELAGALKAPDGTLCSLFAEWIKIGGPVRLNEGFNAAHTVWLLGGNIAANLNCRRATLNGSGVALQGERMKIGGNILAEGLRACSPAQGSTAINLVCADITGNLKCTEAWIHGDWWALNAERLNVKGDVFFNSTTVLHGGILLPDGEVSGNLNFTNTQVNGPASALYALRLKVGSDVVFDSTTIAQGSMLLQGINITGTLHWAPAEQVQGSVDLTDAKAGHLFDNWKSVNGCWPTIEKLRLDGFTYGSITAARTVAVDDRLEWIGSQPRLHWFQMAAYAVRAPRQYLLLVRERRDWRHARRKLNYFITQPYEQLANVYQQAGQDTEAREVALARRRDMRLYGNLSRYRKILNWLLEKTIQYGYQTWRAILALAVVYAAAVAIFWAAQHHGNLIVPLMETASGHQPPPVTHCTNSYPCFYPAGYAIDTVIPIVNVHQATYWGPNGNASLGHALTVFTWLCTTLGWALATLAVAGYTGLVRSADAL